MNHHCFLVQAVDGLRLVRKGSAACERKSKIIMAKQDGCYLFLMKKKCGGDSSGLTGGFMESPGNQTPAISTILPSLEHGFMDKKDIQILPSPSVPALQAHKGEKDKMKVYSFFKASPRSHTFHFCSQSIGGYLVT